MSCQRVMSMLSAYIDGEVQGSDGEMIKQHLATCASCAREFEMISRTSAILADVAEVEPPAFLLEQIEAATVKRRPFWARLRAAFDSVTRVPQQVRWAAAGVAAMGALIGMLMTQLSVQDANQIVVEHPSQDAPVALEPFASQPAAPDVVASESAPAAPSVRITERPIRRTPRVKRARPVSPDTVAATTAPDMQPDEAAVTPDKPADTALTAMNPDDVGNDSDVVAIVPDPEDESADVVVVEKPEPVARNADIVVAVTPSLDDKLSQQRDFLAELRREIANRNNKRKYESQTERIEGRKYSVELASIRF